MIRSRPATNNSSTDKGRMVPNIAARKTAARNSADLDTADLNTADLNTADRDTVDRNTVGSGTGDRGTVDRGTVDLDAISRLDSPSMAVDVLKADPGRPTPAGRILNQ